TKTIRSEVHTNQVFVKIDKHYTQQKLDKLKTTLKQNFNIDFSYNHLNTNAEGEIISLNVKVNCNDGYRGTVTQVDTDGNPIKPIYIKRDYTNKQRPF